MSDQNRYVAAYGNGNLLSAAAVGGYLLGFQDRGIVSKVCGPNSYACQTSLNPTKSMKENISFISYFGEDCELFKRCTQLLTGVIEDFEDGGGDLNEPSNHPDIPPAGVFFGGVEVFRARVSGNANIEPDLEKMRARFNEYTIEVYQTDFDDTEVEQLSFR
jgi:hypothetical protein